MDEHRAFKAHHAKLADALKAAAADLRLVVGVEVRMRRDKYGVSVESTHPKGCGCGRCK